MKGMKVAVEGKTMIMKGLRLVAAAMLMAGAIGPVAARTCARDGSDRKPKVRSEDRSKVIDSLAGVMIEFLGDKVFILRVNSFSYQKNGLNALDLHSAA